MIKNLRILLSVVIILVFSYSSHAQCEDVTLSSITNSGPYDVATLTEADGLRNGPDYSQATLFYPTNATPPYPSIAIVPGFNAGPGAVRAWGPYYASHGIIAMVMGPNNQLAFPDARARALIDALKTLEAENTRTSSPLEGKIDTNKFAVSGHSMGGGGAQRAAVLRSNSDPEIKAVVALNPWLSPSSTPNLNHTVPILIFSGQNYNTAKPSQHANVHYNQTPNETIKLIYEVRNGDHSSAIGPERSQGIMGGLALSWLRQLLDDDNCYCALAENELLNNSSIASSIRTNVTCATLSVDELTNNEFISGVYPNPTNSMITLESKYTNTKKYDVFSIIGKHLITGTINSNKEQIDLSTLTPNVYLLKVDNQVVKILKTE